MPDKKYDPRWILWAQGVCEGATLAQRKWAGKDRPFRRAEYETGMANLEASRVLVFLKKQGYRPNRAGGWRYIQRMARGEVGLPPPLLGTSAPGNKSTVRRARTATRSKIHINLHRESQANMKNVCVHQGKKRSVFYLYNDQGEAVARLEKPRMVSYEEAGYWAEKYRKDHPDQFPGEAGSYEARGAK